MKPSILLAAALLAAATAAHAGRHCEARPPSALGVQRAMTLAANTAAALDASGAQVVVIGRIGQDLSRYGQTYSHIGLAYKDEGRWRVVHKLNSCGSATASVYRQGLGEFFLDDLHDYRAGVVIPRPDVQARLVAVLGDNLQLAKLHTGAYSMVAYPWSTRYQQSNQWALETIALSQDEAAATRERAQSWLRLKGYEPAVLRIDPLTRLGARMSRANIAFDDHPNEKRFTDRIETVSADSVFAWLNRAGLGSPLQTIR
jgi:hypothetical protein